jgi:hypothetical protein
MRSSSLVFVAVFAAFGGVAAASGCSSETDGAGGSSASSATTSSQASNGSTSGMMAGSGGESGTTGPGSGGGAASSSSAGGGGAEAYSSCGECTNTGDGAPTKECKTQYAACTGNQGCQDIIDCWNNCSTDHDGGCCTLACYMSSGANQASIDLFKAYDKCVYCTTCKTLCSDPPTYDAAEYCKVVEGMSTCP